MWRDDKLHRFFIVSHQKRFMFSLRRHKSLNKPLLHWILTSFVRFLHSLNKGLTFFNTAGQVSKSQNGLFDTCNPVIRPSLSKMRDFAQI